MTHTQAIADNLEIPSLEDLMAERIPSHVYIARAVPAPNGKFYALYSGPGLIPAVSQSRDGRPYEYNTEVEAEIGAMRTLYGVLNKPRANARRHGGKPERYKKMTGAEFAVALRMAGPDGVTPSFFSYLYGTSQLKVIGWIDGEDNVPHPARVLLALFAADPKNIDIAEKVTESVTEERKPGRRGGDE